MTQYILPAVLIAMQLFDFWTTKRIIDLGGNETNRALIALQLFMSRALKVNEAYAWLIVVKSAMIAALLYGAVHDWFITPVSQGLLAVVGLYMSYWMIHNWRELDKAREAIDTKLDGQ